MKKPNEVSWVALDKRLATTFSKIRRKYSEIEAMYSLSLDVNCNKQRSIRAYSRMWSWSEGKVKRFLFNHGENEAVTKQRRSSNEAVYSLVLLDNQNKSKHKRSRDEAETKHEYKEQEQEQETTTTSAPKKKVQKKKVFSYSEEFEKFWQEYPRKIGKFKAFESWQKYDCGNGLFDQILSSLQNQKTDESWTKDDGKYIPHGSTWINQRRWEDEGSTELKPRKSRWVDKNAKSTTDVSNRRDSQRDSDSGEHAHLQTVLTDIING